MIISQRKRTGIHGRKAVTAFVVGLSMVATLTGCSSNKGGDTLCKDYKAMSTSERKEVIEEFLKSKGKDPSNGEITLNQLSAAAYCATAGRDSDPIRKIDGS